MSADTWQTVGTIIVLVAIGGFNAWRTKQAEKAASKAVDQTKATGNGFADDVLTRLDRIEQSGKRTERLMVDHLADHAAHDLQKRRQ